MVKLYGPGSWLPQLEFCCCGASLRAGVLFIGWTYLVSLILLVTVFIRPAGAIITGTWTLHNTGQQIAAVLFVETWLLGLLGIFSSVMLLAGVNLKRPRYFLPFILVSLLLVAHGFYLLIMTVFTDVEGNFEDVIQRRNPTPKNCPRPETNQSFTSYGSDPPAFVYPFFILIVTLLQVYFLMVVNSFYTMLIGTASDAPPKYHASVSNDNSAQMI